MQIYIWRPMGEHTQTHPHPHPESKSGWVKEDLYTQIQQPVGLTSPMKPCNFTVNLNSMPCIATSNSNMKDLLKKQA